MSISLNIIYTATYKLENEGKISEYSKLVGRKRTQVDYHIEPEGKKYLDELMTVYRSTITGTNKILAAQSKGQEKDENTDKN